jgi:hypothetical protein
VVERLAPLPATQVSRVQFLIPAGSTINVEKAALFCNPASGTRSQACTAIEIVDCINNTTGVPASRGTGPRVHGIPHSKDRLSLFMVQYSNATCVKNTQKTYLTFLQPYGSFRCKIL